MPPFILTMIVNLLSFVWTTEWSALHTLQLPIKINYYSVVSSLERAFPHQLVNKMVKQSENHTHSIMLTDLIFIVLPPSYKMITVIAIHNLLDSECQHHHHTHNANVNQTA